MECKEARTGEICLYYAVLVGGGWRFIDVCILLCPGFGTWYTVIPVWKMNNNNNIIKLTIIT